MTEFNVVGMKYLGKTPNHITKDLKLEPEPENKHDPHAIRVLVDDRHVGYVAKDSCAKVRAILQICPTPVYTVIQYFDATVKVGMTVSADLLAQLKALPPLF